MIIDEGIDLQKIGQVNRNNILYIIHSEQGISQIDIASKLNLSQSAVSRCVKQLLDSGYIQKAGRGESTGGRKPVFLEIAPRFGYTISIDISRTTFSYAVLDFSENIIFQEKKGFKSETLISELFDVIDTCINRYGSVFNNNLIGIAIGIRGMLDNSGSTVLYSGIFGWTNLPLKNMLEEKYKVTVVVDLHTHFAALGEWAVTYNREIENFVYLSVSWGMSLSVIMNGTCVRGQGNAGEFGITKTLSDSDNKNTKRFQELCAGQHIAAQILEEWDAVENLHLKKLYPEKPDHLLLDDIVDAALKGDPFAMNMVKKTAQNLGVAVCNVIDIFDPEILVLGGSLMELGDILYEPLMESVKQNLLEVQYERVKIEMTQLYGKADLLGGAHRVLQSVFNWNFLY